MLNNAGYHTDEYLFNFHPNKNIITLVIELANLQHLKFVSSAHA